MSVSEVSPGLGLFLSGLDPVLKPSVLSRRNVKLIINASDIRLQYPPALDLEVVEVPVQDQPHAPLDQFFDSVSERIHRALEQNQGVLVHCSAGRSRSPALVLAFLVRFTGQSLVQSYKLVLDSRPFIRINAGFWRQLIDYEVRVQGQSTVCMVKSKAGVLPHILDQDLGVGICLSG